MERENEIIEIDILQILRALWHKAWALVVAAMLGAITLFAYATFMITPLYQSDILLYVNNSSVSIGSTSLSISTTEISAAKSLVNTYMVILKARSTLNDIIEEGDLKYSTGQLSGMISAAQVNGTEVFRVRVTATNPHDAEHIANTIAEVLPSKVADIIDGSSMRIVDWAVTPSGKASPNITRYTSLGMLIGAIAAAAIIIILEITDTQIHSDEYLIENYDLPILAVIPDLRKSSKKGYYIAYQATDAEKGDL